MMGAIENNNLDDEVIFNPYNSANIEITLNNVQSILKIYGINYSIDNIELLNMF